MSEKKLIIVSESDTEDLVDFFWKNINKNKSYISHGEIQMGVAIDLENLSPNGKTIWEIYLKNKISDDNSIVFKYTVDKKIIGFSISQIAEDLGPRFGVICDLMVDELYRNTGIGEFILENNINWFKDKEINNIYLESGKNNHLAHNFFTKRKFSLISYNFKID